MFYRYIAIDPRGARKEGNMEGEAAKAVRYRLKAMGLEPVVVREDYAGFFLSRVSFSAKTLGNNEIAASFVVKKGSKIRA